MMDKLILKLANKILIKNGGRQFVDNVYLVRMSKEFKEWTYTTGYGIFTLEKLMPQGKEELNN